MDQQKIDALGERVLGEVNSAMTALNLYLGHRLGLWEALAKAGTVTGSRASRNTETRAGIFFIAWLPARL